MIITSRENKVYKTAKSLLTKRGRDASGLFIIEGVRSVSDAIKNGAEIEYIIREDGVSEKDFGIREYVFAPRLFCEVSDTLNPQGILGVCRIPSVGTGSIPKGEKSCVILCEQLQDPGNIGTIIRSANAAFCDGVVLTKGCCDLYNPKTVRATMSAIFSIPVVCGESADRIIQEFKNKGYTVIAGALKKDAENLYKTKLEGKNLIVVGNEANGITSATLSLCDKIVKIPMRERAESLNAAIAASVMIYECNRQNKKF